MFEIHQLALLTDLISSQSLSRDRPRLPSLRQAGDRGDAKSISRQSPAARKNDRESPSNASNENSGHVKSRD